MNKVVLPAALEQVRRLDPVLAETLAEDFSRLTMAGQAVAWAQSQLPALLAARAQRTLLTTVVDIARRETGAPRAWALRWSGDLSQGRASFEALAGDGALLEAPPAFSRTILGRVVADGRPAWSDDAAQDARFRAAESVQGVALRSVGCVPLGQRGVLWLEDPDMPGRFALAVRLQVAALCALAGRLLTDDLPTSHPTGPAPEPVAGLIGDTAVMHELFAAIRAFAPMPWPALVLGETGTGKEAVARALHALSPRADGPFIAVNCGAIVESLAESTLFGHERGAFTGADRRQEGVLARVGTGTLFLDEVGELSPGVQTRLLRLLQEGVFQRVGGHEDQAFAGRVVAATHRRLDDPSARGHFREDLYFRLAAAIVRVPPLRERRGDVAALAGFLLQRAAADLGSQPAPKLDPTALTELCGRAWPGNVRELENTLRAALARSLARGDGRIGRGDLAAAATATGRPSPQPHDPLSLDPVIDEALDLKTATERFQRERLRAALAATGGNRSAAARKLGVSRQWLHRLLARDPGVDVTDAFESLLDSLVPGAGRRDASDVDAPDFPVELGLEPRALLARGGSGWVFRAWDPVLSREVAVKISRPDQGATAQDALMAEATRAAALAHPSVLPVHRLVVAGGMVCVEYRLAPDATVEGLLSDPTALTALDLPGRLVLLRGPARALARAHAQGLVHGDVHPGNLVLGSEGEVYLLDWAGPPPDAGDPTRFSGSPGHAAPEVLAGRTAGPAADVFALGAVAWELCAGRPLRPRRRGEDLGTYVGRWAGRSAASLPADLVCPPGTRGLLDRTLVDDPAARIDIVSFVERLDQILSGEAERSRRLARGEALLVQARQTLSRYRELGQRLDDERQVVLVQRTRVPSQAPAPAKQALWAAEDRLEQIELERGLLWLDGVQQAVVAGALGGDESEARDMVAELWWVRMEDSAARGQAREVALAAHQVAIFDAERRGALLAAPCQVSLAVSEDDATVELARLEPSGRRLQPVVHQTLPLPLHRHPVSPGRWQLTVRADGRQALVTTLQLSRSEHAALDLRLYSDAQVGSDWVLLAGGPFLLGGDPLAQQALPRCRPTLADRFVRRTCVTAAEWCRFLADLPADQARQRVPGGQSPTGQRVAWWTCGPDGWQLPEGWDPRWPVVGIDVHDAQAFAEWESERTGRAQRLPTEEEWEKAARSADGRCFPWGDHFDATFAHMRRSRAGQPGLLPVDAFPLDRSPAGCLGMAGGVREWTASWMDAEQVVVRGGSWADDAEPLRCASRSGHPPGWRASTVGFRLISEVPAPA